MKGQRGRGSRWVWDLTPNIQKQPSDLASPEQRPGSRESDPRPGNQSLASLSLVRELGHCPGPVGSQ